MNDKTNGNKNEMCPFLKLKLKRGCEIYFITLYYKLRRVENVDTHFSPDAKHGFARNVGWQLTITVV